MDYKEFFKNELFPEVEVEITDEFLENHGFVKYGINYLDPEKDKHYYYENGIIGRIYVNRCIEPTIYTLQLNHNDHNHIHISKLSDIKAAVYASICGLPGSKYGFDGVGYRWIPTDTKEEEEEYRYNKYCELIKGL